MASNLIIGRSETVFAAGFAGCLAGLWIATDESLNILIPKLMDGFGITVLIATTAALLSIALAFVAGLAKLSTFAPVRLVSIIYAELFRGTSLLVQLFWLFYVLPHFGITLPPLAVGILGIALNYGAYGSEIVRGAVRAVPAGQWEASRALNIGYFSTMGRIILPQAVLIMLPSYGSLMIQLLKSTSLVSLITISDLTFEAYQLDQVTGQTVPIFTIVMIAYFALSIAVSILIRLLERLLGRGIRIEVVTP